MARKLVHRTYLRDVLPTGITRHTDEHFTVSVRWPATHPLHLRDGRYTPSLVIETVRQAGLLTSHAELGVPLGHQFVVWEISQRFDPRFLEKAHAPTDLELDVYVSGMRTRGRIPAEVSLQMAIRIGGRVVGKGSTRYGIVSPGAYRRLRGERHDIEWPPTDITLPEPVEPAAVRRTRECDVALSPGRRPGRWQLRADTANELLFDHSNNHVPAMVLLEAALQAGYPLFGGRPFTASSCEVTCTRYVEFDSPCWIQADLAAGPDGSPSLRVTGEQAQQPAFAVQFHQATPL
ncbi:ScbA/BarX family gamma-butyrolactone biosynthesis protein [Streptomyces sp. HNM0645]|uniref:ScbA/BarX family gamma-butyrolactone biosynthesis protein n=1 Tax=Streptomyces sp. HNM0645 TaxID=2782343 RepID=UPI0024B80596|nr:ScbA/BarX family gamma-butyrolactone biosynthesis protein [Streptomyces sp. HNM0645]MDI9883299.1 ScbA/BarX family gamma-butyrolactone biosynthesis protein [Streptomyces sp. HNM0645]